MQTIRILIKGTVLSALIFLATSYLFVLYRISPITIGDIYTMEIGFPYVYYKQFQLRGNPFLNTQWNQNELLLDIFMYWVVITGLYLFFKKRN
jgi:hypothetical protein